MYYIYNDLAITLFGYGYFYRGKFMKPFESHNKQLKILRRRGMEVPSSAKRDLENENYYNIINGYKDLFLELDVNGNFLVPDKYKQGTHFKEVFSLYKLDRNLGMFY